MEVLFSTFTTQEHPAKISGGLTSQLLYVGLGIGSHLARLGPVSTGNFEEVRLGGLEIGIVASSTLKVHTT